MESFPSGESLGFASLAQSALAYLHNTVGFKLWMVTRVSGEDWIKLVVEDHEYGEKAPSVSPWADSFCSQMVLGRGPRVAPRSAAVPAYANAADSGKKTIGAYIGVPLIGHDGSLFGTLCAIDPQPQPDSIRESLPLIELIAAMISALVSAEMVSSELGRRAEQAKIESETDALTGLHNRRGWDRIVGIEETRCQRYGSSACAIAMDLNGLKAINDTEGHAAGDEYIRRGGRILREGVRKSDFVARVGGDEFLILGIECESAEADAMLERLRRMLDEGGVSASLGMSKRTAWGSIPEAVKEADQLLYREKRARKAELCRGVSRCTTRDTIREYTEVLT